MTAAKSTAGCGGPNRQCCFENFLGYLFLFITLSTVLLQAAPLLEDGSESLRHVKLAMHDEELILSRVWAMVDRGDVDHGIAVYPGFYPYFVGAIRWLLGSNHDVAAHVITVRVTSFVITLAALVLAFVLFRALAKSTLFAGVFVLSLGVHPETILWAARVHPDAILLFWNFAALGCFAFYIEKDKRVWLYFAAVFAGLSAATKLVGCFMVPIIGLYMLWRNRRTPKELLRDASVCLVLFLGVFVLFNPRLFLAPVDVIDGFVEQNKRNRAGGRDIMTWLRAVLATEGLGLVSALTTVFGAAVLFFRRAPKFAFGMVGFGLFFLAYLFSAVSLVEPRYLAPAVWPLFFGALSVLAYAWRGVVWQSLLGGVLVVGFVVYDVPRRFTSMATNASHYARAYSPERRALAEALRELDVKERLISNHWTFVPEPIAWEPVWKLGEIESNPGVKAMIAHQGVVVVVGPEWKSEPAYQSLRATGSGWSLHRTVGANEIFIRTSTESTNAARPPVQ